MPPRINCGWHGSEIRHLIPTAIPLRARVLARAIVPQTRRKRLCMGLFHTEGAGGGRAGRKGGWIDGRSRLIVAAILAAGAVPDGTRR